VGDMVILSLKGIAYFRSRSMLHARNLRNGIACPITSVEQDSSWPYGVDGYQFNLDELELHSPIKCCY